MRINQFHSGTAVGDAITNQMLLIQKILQDNGYESAIYAEHIPQELQDTVYPIKTYKGDADSILFVHHSMGMDSFEKIIALPDRKALIYHNITPEKYFENEWLRGYVRKGLEQAKEYKKYIDYCIADSNYNRQELIRMGHKDIDIMPVQISLDRFDGMTADLAVKDSMKCGKNIIFVGRVVKNKRQDDVIRSFAVYNRFFNQDSHLYIIGDDSTKEYVEELNRIAKELEISESVSFTGKVSEQALKAYYENADLFLCMSEHEGFGVPLLEAMKMGVPVVSYRSSAIPETMGGAGVLVTQKNYAYIGALINELFQDEGLYKRIVETQYERIERLNATNTEKLLLHAIDNIQSGKRKRTVQMQGPFESSYSLAIVNRKLIEAIHHRGSEDVSIYCTEGPGDYEPKDSDLKDKPLAKELWLKSKEVNYPDITIRNMYPPRVHDVNGGLNFQQFGWEESVIPKAYIDNFNQYLNGIGTMSDYVTEKLIECGLNIPVRTMGIGVDLPEDFNDLKPYHVKTKKTLKFLHISSAFPRKGIDLLLKGYYEAFNGDDDVCLILKTFPNPHNRVQEIMDRLNQEYPNPPEIEWINKDLKQDQLYSLYKCADCYIQTARGEGFGLPVAEAMLARVPVIVSPNSGMADFCNENTAFLVGYDMAPAETHLTDNSNAVSMWAEPRVEEIVARMREFVQIQGTEIVTERVSNAYKLISEEFSWDRVAARWIQFIDDVSEKQMKPKVAMVTTWNSKCGIAEFSKMQVESSCVYVDYEIYPNYGTALLSCDEDFVCKRLWHSAFEGDMVKLTEALLKSAAPIVHFQFNFGFFSVKQLGESIKKLRKEKKVIIEFHKTEDALVGQRKISLSTIKNELNMCTKLIVHQEKDCDVLVSMGINRDLINLIPLGQIQYAYITPSVQRANMGIESNHVIGSYGFLLPHKGIKEVIQAISVLKKTYSDILYLAVCALHDAPQSHEYLDECREEIKKLGLEKNVRLITDYLENSQSMKYLQACDMLIMPYKPTKESASGAIRFCMAARRPIITTNQPIFDEFKECVYQIEDTDASLIAKAVTDYMDADSVDKLNHIETYIQETSWYATAQKFYELYQNIE